MIEDIPTRFDVLVIGGGPAGLAAAIAASGAGRVVGLVDDNPTIGGQIWRGGPGAIDDPLARRTFEQIAQARPTVLNGTRVLARAGDTALLAEQAGRVIELHHDRLILATGARELFLPFPGWTRPGVVGAGGIQALVKAGLPIEGKRVVVAGSGPLLLAVAALLRKRGATVAAVIEQASQSRLIRFGLSLGWSEPGKLRQAVGLRGQLKGVPIRPGWWPTEAMGPDNGTIEAVRLTNGRATRDEPCDLLACGWGLEPSLELPSLLGCRVERGAVVTDDLGETSVPGVFAAGEATGIGGVDAAVVEGEIVGFAATGQLDQARRLIPRRDRTRRFARRLDAAFALRPVVSRLARPDTGVCRCEDVRAGVLAGHRDWNDAKLQTRVGMGPCQGRVCGGAVRCLFGWERGSVRPPIYPTSVDNLATILAEAQ